MFSITFEVKGFKKLQGTVEEILDILQSRFKVVDIKFVVGIEDKGENMKVRQSYTVFEIDVNGANVNPAVGDTVTVVSGDETIVTVAPDSVVAPGSLASGFLMATNPGVAGTTTVVASAFNASGVAIGTPKTLTVTVDGTVTNPAIDISFTLGTAE